MKCLRTPEDRFENLPGFPYNPNYVEVPDGEGGSLRVHYVDEGPRDGETVLLMHGEPTWSFLYRKMIPVLVDAGLRAVAPDLAGFGRSDKPSLRSDYTYERHVSWMQGFLDATGLRGITLMGQDWGGLIGLRLLAACPERFARAVAANTGLPTGDQQMPEAFFAWRKFSQETPDFPVGAIVGGGCLSRPDPEVLAAYDAPFPDDSYKEGARIFPALVPAAPDDPSSPANRAAWEVLKAYRKPFLTAFSDGDPITKGGEKPFLTFVPGTQGQTHPVIRGAGHFLQEDKGEELARVIADFIAETRKAIP